MVIWLERDADLHTAQLMPLPLTVSCDSKIQIGFTFLVPAHLGSPGKRAIKWVCVCVLHNYFLAFHFHFSYHSTCHNPNPNHYLIQPKFSQLFCRQQSKFQEKSTYNLLLVPFRSKQKITFKT